jgi:hypothetical protein
MINAYILLGGLSGAIGPPNYLDGSKNLVAPIKHRSRLFDDSEFGLRPLRRCWQCRFAVISWRIGRIW